MPQIDSSLIGKFVSFDVFPSSVLGTTTYQHVKVLGITSAQFVYPHIDPVSMHRNVYPTLPSGVPDRFDAYSYVILKFQNGEVTALGLPWIDESSLQVIEASKVIAQIFGAGPADLEVIRQMLIANGWHDFKIDVEEV